MVKDQNWFDREYSEERLKVKIIRIVSGGKFQGQLVIENYPKLEKLFLRGFNSIDKVIIKDLSQLKECTIWDCGLTKLTIKNCSKINKLHVNNNLLTDLDFLESLENSIKLELNISSNNFAETGLTSFGKIIKLHDLNIGNPLVRNIFWGTYNRFSGSLRPLKNTRELRELDISNTNINSEGLQHLPESINKIACSSDFMVSWIRENDCSQIAQELEDYWISGNCYDLARWRNNQPFYDDTERIIVEEIRQQNINIQQGHAIINSQLGNNTNLSYYIEQPPK